MRPAAPTARIAALDSTVTCWTLIRGAAARRAEDRAEFARRYAPVVRAFFGARWAGRPLLSDLDDAVQEVFVDCFKAGGALERARPGACAGFRPFLRGVARNVALRFEERARRRSRVGAIEPDELTAESERISQAFDRAWAQSVVRDAAEHMARTAPDRGPEAVRRADLLRLRFQDGAPIREIARSWGADPVRLHREYAKARREFKRSLLAVVSFHLPAGKDELEAECRKLLALLRA